MGKYYLVPDVYNPTGYFEDMEIAQVETEFINERISKKEWKEKTQKLIEQREQFPRWGWKALGTASIIGEVIDLVPAAKFIWCKRNIDDAVRSMKRLKTEPYELLRQIMIAKEEHVQKHLSPRPHFVVEYNQHREKLVDDIINFAELSPTREQKARAEIHILAKPLGNNQAKVVHSKLI